MALKIIGKVYRIGNTQSIQSKNGGQPFQKRELILDATRFDGLTGERGADNFPMFEFSGEKCSELDNYKVNDVVEVSFEVQGAFYKDKDDVEKNFTRVRGYKIEHYQWKRQAPKSTQPTHQSPPPLTSNDCPPPPENGDLPF